MLSQRQKARQRIHDFLIARKTASSGGGSGGAWIDGGNTFGAGATLQNNADLTIQGNGQALAIGSGQVTWQRSGNSSYVLSIEPADFNITDGAPHVVATIPLPQSTTKNVQSRLDILVQLTSATDSWSGSFTGKWQNINGVVTQLGTTVENDADTTVGAGGWTVTVTLSGTNIVVTATAANGVRASTVVQQKVGISP